MSNFAGTRTMSKDYTSTDIAFEYIFAPGQQTDKPTITSHIGPPIHIGDPNYPYFAYALKTAEEILCPEECAKPLDFNTIPKSHLRVLAQELISNKDIDELMRLKEHAQAYFEHTDHNPGYSGEWDYWEYAYLIDEINKGLLSIDSNNSSDQDTIVE